MNFFVLRINEDGVQELVTCPLDGSVLPGVTRNSVITAAKEFGIETVEAYMTITEFLNGIKRGKILEAFGCGTACTVCPISQITHRGQVYKLMENSEEPGVFSKKMNDYIMDIQYGNIEHEWSYKIV